MPIAIDGGITEETLRDAAGAVRGRIVRERWPLSGTLRCAAMRYPARRRCASCGCASRTTPSVVAGERSGALRTAFVSTQSCWRRKTRGSSRCSTRRRGGRGDGALGNRHVFPVLVGEAAADEQRAALVLASPIILYDFPAVAPQTDADAFDGTEIDELLTLSVLSLPDAERDEARATDPRARAIIERAESSASTISRACTPARCTASARRRPASDPLPAGPAVPAAQSVLRRRSLQRRRPVRGRSTCRRSTACS